MCLFEHHNFWSQSWSGPLDECELLALVRPPLHLGNAQTGKPKKSAGSPFAKVNSPEGKSKWNTSLANDGAECSPIKKSPSPSKTATPSSEGTKRPSLPRQQEECSKGHEKSSRHIENAVLRLRLRRRIEKIWQLSADVVEGYGKHYAKKYRTPLPVDVIVKIKTRFLHHVEHQCAELGLSVNKEKQWTPDLDLLDEIDLSDSGEESEEHSSDDVNYYSGSSSEDEVEEDGQLKDDTTY